MQTTRTKLKSEIIKSNISVDGLLILCTSTDLKNKMVKYVHLTLTRIT